MKYIKKFESIKKPVNPVITYYDNGQKGTESYYINGKLHKEDGPAYQYWIENGQKESEIYYINDFRYTREEWIEKLKEINSPHYEEELMKYKTENYNL